MNIIDTHCDALLKLQMAKRGDYYEAFSLNYKSSPQIQTNLNRLKPGNVKVQFFAIFIHPSVSSDEKWQHALEQIDLFYSEIIEPNPEVKHIRKWNDLDTLEEEEIGAVLTLEGAEPFGDDLVKLRTLYRLGVLSVGLTWNHANLLADGAEEPRGAGLTVLGKEVVKLNNQHQVFTDVSHASVQSFWDMLEIADYPIASHSNARALCDHPRNLDDEQIKEMFKKNGLIHVVFYPPFINKDRDQATISDLIKHIDYLCSLGGARQIGFGSDFDGISLFVDQLEHAGKYQNLINELLKIYPEDIVRGFAYRNFLTLRPQG